MNHLSTSQLALVAEIQKRHLHNQLQHSDNPQEQHNKVAVLNKRFSIRTLFSAIVNRQRKQHASTATVPSLVNQ